MSAAKTPGPARVVGRCISDAWVQQFYGAELLFDLGDLPGAATARWAILLACQRAFTASSRLAPGGGRSRSKCRSAIPWCAGRIDAVFVDRRRCHRGGLEDRRAAARAGGRPSSSSVHRLAWGRIAGCPVRTAFYYVRSGITVVPDELPAPGELVMH